jgi:lambda family phage minor tail protein L
MPYNLTTSMKQEGVKLTPDQIVECYIIDLASIHGYMAFSASTKKIIARDRDGLFPVTRILVGDIITVYGSTLNDGNYTVTNVTATDITVSEALSNESTKDVKLFNYLYFIKSEFNKVGYKMRDGDLVNVEEVYFAANIRRENIEAELQSSSKGLVIRINIGNVDRVVESLIQNRVYLRGCNVYLVTMYAKHFPSGSGHLYIGSAPDYLSNIVEKLVIDSATSNEANVTFDCRYKFFFKDFQLPARIMDRNFCAWARRYKGPECDPTDAINGTTYPTCNGTLADCRERGNTRRFGGFPSIPKQAIYI